MLNSPKVADIPIIDHFTKKLPISNLQQALIPPQTLVSITCKLSHNDDPRFFLKQKKELVMAEVNTVLHSDLKTPDTLVTFHNFQKIQIPLFNSSTEDILHPTNFDLATLDILDELTDIFQLNVTLDVHQPLELNSAQEIIQNDESLDNNEKEQACMEYLQSGKYTKSMSQLIIDSPSVTQMKLQKMEPWPLDEFDKKIDLQHLPQKSQKHALKVFKKKINIFCRHEMDIGCANDIKMDIEIDSSKPRIQTYYPLPLNVRDGVRKILDQMVEYGILRECPEPSNFVSNLLVTKKRNGNIRILLYCRLLNNATIRKATALVSPIKVFAHAAQKAYISTINILNAFFQIPIKYEHQCYTAFYSDAHGKRYCFTRAPQGLKNSPLFLKLLMDKMFASSDLLKHVIYYADDIMIATNKSLSHHIEIIDKVLDCFEKSNIKIKAQKMSIAKPEVEFLGIIWRKGMLHIPTARISAFKNMLVPKTPKKVKSFVCVMSYYRCFIPKFAELAKPLMDRERG